MAKSKVEIHRVEEVRKTIGGVFKFPVAERRQERVLSDEEFNAYDGVPNLGDGTDESDDAGLAIDADSDADNQPAEADVPSAGAEATTTGVDTRGFG